MPKDEFDLDDPMTLTGVALPGDRTEEMARCFIEEYAMMGYGREQILHFFQNPFYVATHQVWRAKGRDYVEHLIKQALKGDEVDGESL